MSTEQRAPSEGECVLAEAILRDDSIVGAVASSVLTVVPIDVDLNDDGEWFYIRDTIASAVGACVSLENQADPDGAVPRAIPEEGWRPIVVATLIADVIIRIVQNERDDDDDGCIHCQIEEATGYLVDARMNLVRLLEDESLGLNGVEAFHNAMRSLADAAEELGLSVEELNKAAKDAAEEEQS